MKKLSNLIYALFCIDIAIFLAATCFAGLHSGIPLQAALLAGIVFALFGSYVLFLKGYYRVRSFKPKDIYLLFEGIILGAIIPAAIVLLVNFSAETLKFLVFNFIFTCILLLVWRSGFWWYKKHFESATNVLILGNNPAGYDIYKEITNRPELNFNVTEVVDGAGLENSLKNYRVDLVVNCTDKEISSEELSRSPEVYEMSAVYEKITHKVPVNHITEDWFRENFAENLEKPVYAVLKRIFDIGSAVVILLVTFPVLLIVALSVKLYDGGPVLYVQNRIGKNGRTFRFYKLRTMVQNADKAGIIDKVEAEDERVLPVCRIARKARFDEIPQMINILKGDMSIVGPRAEFEDFVREYEKVIPFYNRRHDIIPGWTGWAQINQGHCVTVEDITEKLRYDFYYIKHRNIFWDFSILLRAVFLALSGRHR